MSVTSKSIPEESTTPAWAPEKPPLRKYLDDLAMRAVGRGGVGLSTLLGSRAAGALGILTYHRTAEPVHGLPKPFYNVTPRRFRSQLTGLLDRGFQIWPLKRALDYWAQGTSIPPRTIVLTFDDGFETVYRHAWPVLQEFRVPATVFLSTAYLGLTAPFPFDAWGMKFQDSAPVESYRPLSAQQCRRMARDGLVEFGAHTHTHRDFRRRPQAFERDLHTSVEIVRSLFDQELVTFAFPYGNPYAGFADGALAAAARRTGVVCALTTETGLVSSESDPFHWGRFNVFEWDTAATLAAKLEGWYSWAPRLRQGVARAIRTAFGGGRADSIVRRKSQEEAGPCRYVASIDVPAVPSDNTPIGFGDRP